MATNLSVKQIIRKYGRWKLVLVKDVFTQPGVNDVLLVLYDIDL